MMTENPPTTDEIRELYIWGAEDRAFVTETQAEEEFDHWLNSVLAEAWADGVENEIPNPYRTEH